MRFIVKMQIGHPSVLLKDIFMVAPHQLTRTVIGSARVEGKILYDGKVLMAH
jgi:hypothetical protein